jgi:DNA-binding transcriptional LysR family regulator
MLHCIESSLRISRKSMDLLGALGVLVRVAETGSFSAVARERELSQAAIARQISQLEEHFGVRLFHRTTRKLSLTNDGETLLGYARPVLDGVEGMESVLGRQSSSPVGLVRVGVAVAASHFLAPRLPTLIADHPGLEVELVVSDRSSDMIEDRLDLALRPGDVSDASLVTRSAGSVAFFAVAAPAYVEQRGAPVHPSELTDHTCLVHDTGPDSDLWTFNTLEGSESVRVPGGFLANDSSAVLLAARAGHGIAFLPQVQVFDDLRAGKLVRVLSDYPAPDLAVSLVYSSRRHLAPRTRLVMDFILEQIRQFQKVMTATDETSAQEAGVLSAAE